MHQLYEAAHRKTHSVIGAAIEVHRAIGPGLLESIYEWCLTKELELQGSRVSHQETVEVHYKGFERTAPLKFDLLVDNILLVEIKAVETIRPIHKAQLLTYMKLLDLPLGLLINFHETRLTDGVSRLILQGADAD